MIFLIILQIIYYNKFKIMCQIYHSNATTNVHNRQQIHNSAQTNAQLAVRYNTSKQTVSKWKNRKDLNDNSSRPHTIHYSMDAAKKTLAYAIRTTTWLPIDTVLDMLNPNFSVTRSSLYRFFVAQGINREPQQVKEKAKKFKEYQPGYIHIDVTYLPKFGGQKYYLFVAIDRATRTLFYEVYQEKTAENAQKFLNNCLDFFPFTIEKILTDNGLEFTNRLIKSKYNFRPVCSGLNDIHALYG
jgi:hypothetical protein